MYVPPDATYLQFDYRTVIAAPDAQLELLFNGEPIDVAVQLEEETVGFSPFLVSVPAGVSGTVATLTVRLEGDAEVWLDNFTFSPCVDDNFHQGEGVCNGDFQHDEHGIVSAWQFLDETPGLHSPLMAADGSLYAAIGDGSTQLTVAQLVNVSELATTLTRRTWPSI